MASVVIGTVIVEAISLVEEAEKIKGYWDDKGLDMHIAVKLDGRLAVSTKHWGRNHYIVTELAPEEIWKEVAKVSKKIGRSLVKSKLGPYVYIPKLNIEQTQDIFDIFKEHLGYKVQRKYGFSWNIDDAVILLDYLKSSPREVLEKIDKETGETEESQN